MLQLLVRQEKVADIATQATLASQVRRCCKESKEKEEEEEEGDGERKGRRRRLFVEIFSL